MDDDARMATVRFRSPGGRWLTVTGEVVEPACICDQITSRLFSCPVHPTRIPSPDTEGGAADNLPKTLLDNPPPGWLGKAEDVLDEMFPPDTEGGADRG